MSAPARCADCFFFRCDRDCACRCHRSTPATRCHYCRCGEHGQCERAKTAGITRYPDVLACVCDPVFHKTKEAAT